MANKVSIVSLGCPKNLVDSDNLTRRLISNGFSYLHNPDDADILLINTCGFIEDAKKESIEEILKLAKLKKGSRIQGDSPRRVASGDKGSREKTSSALEPLNHRTPEPYPKLIVFGCLAKRYKDELIKEISEIDAIFGVGEEERIVEYCKKIRGIGDLGLGLSKINPQPLTPNPGSYAYLKIADGCNKKCTYCVIPSIRGKYKSIVPDEIIKEAKRLIEAGVKELILVAQDTACYGKDLNEYNIASLLKDLCSINGDFWIRLLYAYPASISDSLLNVIAGEDKICKYLDIPFQHSEDRILKLMRRRGNRKEYLTLIRDIRRNIPDIALRTTFIVGFPSETEKEFNPLIDFIEEVRFDRLGVFRYSKEEGTPASELRGHVAEAVKRERLDKIMRHQARISLEKNKELIGRKFKAIVDEISEGAAIGRLYSHAPEIDGVVIIESPEGRRQKAPPHPPLAKGGTRGGAHSSLLKAGDFVNVEITDAFDYDLKGILLDE